MDSYCPMTYIYSSPCVEYFKSMVDSMLDTFHVNMGVDDLFWYGVFCTPGTYASFQWKKHEAGSAGIEIPVILISGADMRDKKAWCRNEMERVMMGIISKPEWMVFVEEETTVDCLDQRPSTFLYIMPKAEEYKEMGEKIREFLYSIRYFTKTIASNE